MKIKLLFLAATLFSLNNSIAQNQTINNVSIGIDYPAYGTTIKANFPGATSGWARGYSIANESGNQNFIMLGCLGNVTNGVANVSNSFIGTDHTNQYLTFLSSGNIGIGNTTPATKLDVAGSITLGSQSVNLNTTKLFLKNPAGQTWALSSGSNMVSENNFSIYNWSYDSGNPYFTIVKEGNVGIGTTVPDEKLTVKGKIHAQEVRVDLQGACAPDYVFQKYYTGKSELKSDYSLPTLAEIENFTKENHHLPNVPSAKEVQENGLSLGEMSNVLLQKIEELTLYAIDQQKEIDRLKTENEKYNGIAERLSAIEKELKK